MTRRVYKYSPPGVLDLMFEREGYCGIKCSYPKDYNDPYELFLSVDLKGSTELLATYREIVQKLPQFPTTCFSNAPTVTPMWAHYAQNHAGFVLEFDADALESHFKDVMIRDVTYRDEPDPDIKQQLARAATTKKGRHAVWLRNTVVYQAYYSKFPSWAYEEECRLVATDELVEDVSGSMILFVPTECLTRIIVGKNASKELVERSHDIAKKYGVDWLQSQVGKSNSLPYFTGEGGSILTHKDGKISAADNTCATCSEPIGDEEELCPWCSITDAHAREAALGNPFRIMDHFGLLDDYLRGAEELERSFRKR